MKSKILILVVGIFIFFSSVCYATSYDIEKYKIEAEIMKNGDLYVTEYLQYDFSEDMNGVYRDILYNYQFEGQENSMEATSLRYQATGIKDVKAWYSAA